MICKSVLFMSMSIDWEGGARLARRETDFDPGLGSQGAAAWRRMSENIRTKGIARGKNVTGERPNRGRFAKVICLALRPVLCRALHFQSCPSYPADLFPANV